MYFTKLLTRNPNYINYLSYGAATKIVALKIAQKYIVWKLSLGLWDYKSSKAVTASGPADC